MKAVGAVGCALEYYGGGGGTNQKSEYVITYGGGFMKEMFP